MLFYLCQVPTILSISRSKEFYDSCKLAAIKTVFLDFKDLIFLPADSMNFHVPMLQFLKTKSYLAMCAILMSSGSEKILNNDNMKDEATLNLKTHSLL